MLLGVLEIQTGFTSGVGKCLDAAMIAIVTTIELHLRDAGRRSLFCEQLTNFCRRITVATVLDLRANALVASAGTDKRLTSQIVYELATEVLKRSVNAQTRMISRATKLVANVVTTSESTLVEDFVLVHRISDRLWIGFKVYWTVG
ncbi:hypothetical protein Pla22_20840 [Rubripirellula amarantea]|uniref:Uncharacterized protein n=1 Tax=Rubripirellula amarantea TaxID=2527999 RepID=A0A5C5WUM1_9BACT|nr:hypothetical protein Pla22_20840 [Rubripirellula amarantea]